MDISNDQYVAVLRILRLLESFPVDGCEELLSMISLSNTADNFIRAVKELGWETDELMDNVEKLKIVESEIALVSNAKWLSILDFNILISQKQGTSREIPKFLQSNQRQKIGTKYSHELAPIPDGLLWNFIKLPLEYAKETVQNRSAWWKEWRVDNTMWLSYFDAATEIPSLLNVSKLREFWKHLSAGQFLILWGAFTLLPTLASILALPFMPPDVRADEMEQMRLTLLFCVKFVALTLGPAVAVLQGLEVVRNLAYPETPGMVISRWRTGKAEIASLFRTTKDSIGNELRKAFSLTPVMPLKFMETIKFDVFLPAITTNYRADSIRWKEITYFITDEFNKCGSVALNFETETFWFNGSLESYLVRFYQSSDLIGLLKITFWRRSGMNLYRPSPQYVSTYRRPEPFNPVE